MIKDAFTMIGDVGRVSNAVNIWGAILNIPQFIGGLIFIGHTEARLVLITLVFTLLVAGQIHKVRPYSRLIGLCHLPWLVLLPILVSHLWQTQELTAYSAWLAFTAIVIGISLIFDVLDVARYVKGEKQFAWAPQEVENQKTP